MEDEKQADWDLSEYGTSSIDSVNMFITYHSQETELNKIITSEFKDEFTKISEAGSKSKKQYRYIYIYICSKENITIFKD